MASPRPHHKRRPGYSKQFRPQRTKLSIHRRSIPAHEAVTTILTWRFPSAGSHPRLTAPTSTSRSIVSTVPPDSQPLITHLVCRPAPTHASQMPATTRTSDVNHPGSVETRCSGPALVRVKATKCRSQRLLFMGIFASPLGLGLLPRGPGWRRGALMRNLRKSWVRCCRFCGVRGSARKAET